MNNRKKGHDGERYYVKEFKALGFDKCVTSRYGSRLLDDCGVDLVNVPFNVQIKTGIHKGLNPVVVLQYIKARLEEKLPKDSPHLVYPTIIIHKRPVGSGCKRTDFEEVVTLTFNDFKKLIKNHD